MHWSKVNEFVLPLGIIGCLLVFVVPLPAVAIDVLLAANIAIGVVVLLTTLYVRTPIEFSLFPTVLLTTTLARLVLNVATTRLILTKGDTVGLSAAGQVIRQFGEYVSGDRLTVGFVIFGIIFVIQMLVITKGATRISEVAARFSLDGIPGRQMAIDADLNAGVIDQTEAQQRRATLNRQADFYGAMDGASKFVRGDAIAGVVITLINIVGGLSIGVLQGSMGLVEATEVYTKLTIGDGLVSQIPALLISMAAGLLVTRSSEHTNLPTEFLRQLFTKKEVLVVAGSFLALLAFTKLPTTPLAILAAACILPALLVQASPPSSPPAPTSSAKRKPPQTADKQRSLSDFLRVDAIELELGRSLVDIASSARGGDLLAKIRMTRERVAGDLGLMLPSIRVRDNLSLPEDQYVIRLSGNTVASGSVPADRVIVLPPRGLKPRSLPGSVPFSHPSLDKRARIVTRERVADAKALGCVPVSPSGLITRHLQLVVYEQADELLTRDATKLLVDEVRKTAPTVVDELIPDVMKLSEVQQVLRALVRERVPIRQLALILEVLGDHATTVNDPLQLTEIVRKRLGRTITSRYIAPDGQLHVVMLDPKLEAELAGKMEASAADLSTKTVSTFQDMLRATLDRLSAESRPPVLLSKSNLRRTILKAAQEVVPEVVVLGRDEVPPDSQIRSVGIVGIT